MSLVLWRVSARLSPTSVARGSNNRSAVILGSSLLLGLVLAPWVFLRVLLFPFLHKNTPNSILISCTFTHNVLKFLPSLRCYVKTKWWRSRPQKNKTIFPLPSFFLTNLLTTSCTTVPRTVQCSKYSSRFVFVFYNYQVKYGLRVPGCLRFDGPYFSKRGRQVVTMSF